MGKRYYCDYCDRSFLDGAENRKKHINGVQHQKMRKLHYDNFRNAADILQEEATKNTCKRFKLTGNCDFGPTCRFSHLTPDEINYLQDQARREQMKNELKDISFPKVDDNWLKAWLNKVENVGNRETSSDQILLELEIGTWSIPRSLSAYGNIPPSLIPSTIEDIKNTQLSTWE